MTTIFNKEDVNAVLTELSTVLEKCKRANGITIDMIYSTVHGVLGSDLSNRGNQNAFSEHSDEFVHVANDEDD